jgi:hypothetical protein
MNTAKVICSSLRHLFLNRVSTQSGVPFVLLVLNGDVATLNCGGLLLNDSRCACAARGDAGYTKGYSDRVIFKFKPCGWAPGLPAGLE